MYHAVSLPALKKRFFRYMIICMLSQFWTIDVHVVGDVCPSTLYTLYFAHATAFMLTTVLHDIYECCFHDNFIT